LKVIDFSKFKKEADNENIRKKIKLYSNKITIALEAMDDILNDIEESGIDWFEVEKEQQEKIEAISKSYLFLETYLGWARHY
jgi:hypothetical protein